MSWYNKDGSHLPVFKCPRCGETIVDDAFIDREDKSIIACDYCASRRDYDNALVDAFNEDEEIAVDGEYEFADYWKLYEINY